MNCHRCGELITAPYFHNGKPYGYSCIRLVNPSVKKVKDCSNWVAADSNNFNPDKKKQLVSALINNKRFSALVITDTTTGKHISLDRHAVVDSETGTVYINLSLFH
jgi:hypothetical protein